MRFEKGEKSLVKGRLELGSKSTRLTIYATETEWASFLLLTKPITRRWAELVLIDFANKTGCLHLE